MRKVVTAAVFVLIGTVAVPAVLFGQPPAPDLVLKVEGQLTKDDPVDPVLKKGFHKVYPVKLAAGKHYQIDLVSKDFDAYLRLEDAKGKQLAEDDDSGGDVNARIAFKAPKTDAYRIVVTTFEAKQAGNFLLAVKKLDEAAAQLQKLLNDAHAKLAKDAKAAVELQTELQLDRWQTAWKPR
jgi:hypothetical protein